MKFIATFAMSLFLSAACFASDFFNPQEAYNLYNEEKAVIVDIRELSEWQQSGLASPAVWLANSSIESRDNAYKSFIENHDKNKSIIFYCRSGARASRALKKFKAMGFSVFNMGGLVHWKNAGLPLKQRP